LDEGAMKSSLWSRALEFARPICQPGFSNRSRQEPSNSESIDRRAAQASGDRTEDVQPPLVASRSRKGDSPKAEHVAKQPRAQIAGRVYRVHRQLTHQPYTDRYGEPDKQGSETRFRKRRTARLGQCENHQQQKSGRERLDKEGSAGAQR